MPNILRSNILKGRKWQKETPLRHATQHTGRGETTGTDHVIVGVLQLLFAVIPAIVALPPPIFQMIAISALMAPFLELMAAKPRDSRLMPPKPREYTPS